MKQEDLEKKKIEYLTNQVKMMEYLKDSNDLSLDGALDAFKHLNETYEQAFVLLSKKLLEIAKGYTHKDYTQGVMDKVEFLSSGCTKILEVTDIMTANAIEVKEGKESSLENDFIAMILDCGVKNGRVVQGTKEDVEAIFGEVNEIEKKKMH